MKHAFTMIQETNNPLDPVLDLTYEVRGGIYTYYLTITVPGYCLDGESQQLITDPVTVVELAALAEFSIKEGEVNDVVSLDAVEYNESCDNPAVMVTISNNPDGKPGSIVVLISPPAVLPGHSPQSDGKAIIRFEKARP